MREEHWRKGDTEATSVPLQGRKIGFLSYGHANKIVHKLLSGFDAEFSITRRDWEKQQTFLSTPATQYTYNDLYNFLKEISTLIVAVSLTEKTKGMLGRKELELLVQRD